MRISNDSLSESDEAAIKYKPGFFVRLKKAYFENVRKELTRLLEQNQIYNYKIIKTPDGNMNIVPKKTTYESLKEKIFSYSTSKFYTKDLQPMEKGTIWTRVIVDFLMYKECNFSLQHMQNYNSYLSSVMVPQIRDLDDVMNELVREMEKNKTIERLKKSRS